MEGRVHGIQRHPLLMVLRRGTEIDPRDPEQLDSKSAGLIISNKMDG